MKKSTKARGNKHFSRLISIMARLRGKDGCPWDRKQDHASLVPYLFAEAKEVKQAVKNKDWDNLEEELGDILLQVVFHSQVASEKGRFNINDVIRGISKKLVRRHPHVFGKKKLKTAEAVTRQWEEIKRKEKQRKLQISNLKFQSKK